MKVMVRKKSGKLQPFILKKIMASVAAAGAGASLMSEITSDVVKELLGDVERGVETLVIPTQKIRKAVVHSLSRKNKRIASSYKAFQKSRR